MKNLLFIFIALSLICCKQDNAVLEAGVNKLSASDNIATSNNIIATVTPHLDTYIDLENASISNVTVPGVKNGTLYDNGREFSLHKTGDGILPSIEGRYSLGSRGLMATIAANSAGQTSRSELGVKNILLNAERCIGFDVYFDGSFMQGPFRYDFSNWCIFTQFWQDPNGAPPITLEIMPDTIPGPWNKAPVLGYKLTVRNDVLTSTPTPATRASSIRYIGTMARKRWHRFAMKIYAAPAGGAYLELYQNGVLKKRVTGLIGYTPNTTVHDYLYWKVGLYQTGSVSWPLQHAWFDEIKYGRTLGDVDYDRIQ